MKYIVRKLIKWLTPCHKESMGYKCRHQTLPSGKKECGENKEAQS